MLPRGSWCCEGSVHSGCHVAPSPSAACDPSHRSSTSCSAGPQGVDQIEALAASAAHARVGAGELVRQAGAEVEVCMQQHLVCTSHGPSRPECVKGFAGRQTSPTGRVLAHTFIVPAPL